MTDSNKADKPEGAKVGWHLLDTQYAYQGKMMRLRVDHLQVEGQGEIHYDYEERAEAVIMIPVTKAGQVLLIRQYRYPVDEWCLEVPAGGCHDTGEADLEDVVRKELKEEIGATGGQVHYISSFYTSNSFSTEKCHVYLVTGIEQNHDPEHEGTERIEIHPVPVAEALRLARSGEIKTGPCALAILMCEDTLRQNGYL